MKLNDIAAHRNSIKQHVARCQCYGNESIYTLKDVADVMEGYNCLFLKGMEDAIYHTK